MRDTNLQVINRLRIVSHYLAPAILIGFLGMGGVVLLAQSSNAAQSSTTTNVTKSTLKLDTGKEIYTSGCVSCHGSDGRGQAQELIGFTRPVTFPDFTDCRTATPEPDVQWRSIVTDGGPARAFSQIMPSFKDLLTPDQIAKVVEYLRSLCTNNSWPRGNLNLPRPMVAEKAFPEDEVVVTAGFNAHGSPGAGTSVIFEKRFGPSGMIETSLPYNFASTNGSVHSGFGDIAIGYKRKIVSDWKRGYIFSLGGDVSIPTGNSSIGTGGLSTSFETFAAYGQILPKNSFLQVHTGVELPVHPDKLPRAVFVRTAVGKTFSTGGGFGRGWSPMTEFIVDRDLVTAAKTNFDVVPEIQIPINKRMHILAAVGLQIPVNNTAGRPKQALFYILWDFVDGTLRDGWKWK